MNRPSNSVADSSGSATIRLVAGHTAPLTGRETELATLSAALQSADQGRGGTIILAGESGIGKTRLASALVEQATKRGFTVAVGRAYPVETGVPYAVFGDALLPLLRGLDPAML